MSAIKDILSSFFYSLKDKAKQPILSLYLGSWVLCNWKPLAILFFGEGTRQVRINEFSDNFHNGEYWVFFIYIIPLIITVIYIFIFPWILLWVNGRLINISNKLRDQNLSIELNKTRSQSELFKERLKFDPDKEFLPQIVQQEIESNKLRIESIELDNKQKEEELKVIKSAAMIKTIEEQQQHEIAETENSKRKAEQAKYSSDLEISRASAAANQYPIAHEILIDLSKLSELDEINLSVADLGETIACFFQYESFKDLLNDKDFNNSKFLEVSFILFDTDNFQRLMSNKKIKDDQIVDMAFEYFLDIFEKRNCKVVFYDDLANIAISTAKDERYSLQDYDNVASVMATSDTIYESFDIEDVSSIDFSVDGGIEVVVNGSANGYYRKDSDAPGRDIDLKIQLSASLCIGKNAFSKFKVMDVHASFSDEYIIDDGLKL